MAIFVEGVCCAICGEKLERTSCDWFGVMHFIIDENHPLYKYSECLFHYSCFENWEHKEEFERVYKQCQSEIPEIKDKPLVPDPEEAKEERGKLIAELKAQAEVEKQKGFYDEDVLSASQMLDLLE